MSSDVAIQVENISKCYQIYDNPRDRLLQFVLPRLQRFAKRNPKQYFKEFWALQDISFEVKKGESVGIVGRNGSGKSTLLQIICGTITPTRGEIATHGRVAPLLELGSGFNPEFTGRENVYMNANVLGLNKEEIDERFDDIASFADIGEFMEHPVKMYSSGMYLRLAFAVIAHVDADILVVDEALAVGDAIFTQKCMKFIRSFKENDKTLIFVSHDSGAVQSLCNTGVWLHDGRIKQIGTSKKVSEAYLQFTLQETYGDSATLHTIEEKGTEETAVDYGAVAEVQDNTESASGWATGSAEIISISMQRISPGPTNYFDGGERVRVEVHAKANQPLDHPIIGFLVRDRLGQDLFGENTLPFTDIAPRPVSAGQELIAQFEFRLPMLPNGQYTVMASIADGDLYNNTQHHWLNNALIINVSSSKVRWGLVGVSFERVVLEIDSEQ